MTTKEVKKKKEQPKEASAHAQEMSGEVVRRSGDKTVAVAVQSVKVNRLYSKRRMRTSVFLAHDEKNEAAVGQKVIIRACRPLSAKKRWRVVSVVKS